MCGEIYDYITSIIFDQSGYIATNCYTSSKLYLHNNNLTYTGKSISTSEYPNSMAFDSKDRLVVFSINETYLYY